MDEITFKQAIEQRQRRDDRPGEAEMRSRYALWLVQHERWEAAASQFDAAVALASADNQPQLAAQYRYAMGLVLQKDPTLQRHAQQTMRQAADQFAQADDSDNLARAQRHLGVQAAQRGNMTAAIEAINAALLAGPTDQALQAELHADRAMYAYFNDRPQDAERDFALAGQLAAASGDRALAARIEGLQALWHGKLDEKDPLVRQLQSLLAQAPASESALYRAVVALEAGQARRALQQAQAVRRSALSSNEPLRYLVYLNACVIMALSFEKMGRDARVIETLLTCKQTLERALGRAAGQQMNRMLDALLPRWGEKRFEAALSAYRSSVNGS